VFDGGPAQGLCGLTNELPAGSSVEDVDVRGIAVEKPRQ
jgi:hypothetical protein